MTRARRRLKAVGAEVLENPLASTVAKLPESVQERIEACPAPGQAVHPCLFETALLLQRYFSEDQIEHVLSPTMTRNERAVDSQSTAPPSSIKYST